MECRSIQYVASFVYGSAEEYVQLLTDGQLLVVEKVRRQVYRFKVCTVRTAVVYLHVNLLRQIHRYQHVVSQRIRSPYKIVQRRSLDKVCGIALTGVECALPAYAVDRTGVHERITISLEPVLYKIVDLLACQCFVSHINGSL